VSITPVGNSITPNADEKYDRAVADLQVTLEHNRANLDTATVRVLETSLARIDRAITDAQRALDADPNSAYLNDHLSRIKRKKLDLLRQGTSLARAS
jgi:tetratricopeptide (TPR) repeat protein